MDSERDRYSVSFKPSAQKALAGLSKKDQRLVARRVDSLALDPRPSGVEKLKGGGDLHRVRSGNYRIVYQIRDRVLTVLVVAIGHRRDVYDLLDF
ncbi:MAG: type II toxin-antitoxin system RelE/ParE family toxin [Candidatus Eisenbacteria bacterium]